MCIRAYCGVRTGAVVRSVRRCVTDVSWQVTVCANENRAQIPQDTFLLGPTLCLFYVICYLLPLYEDADYCAETYEYTYTYDHQYESLHLPDLLYCGFALMLSLCCYTKTPIAALRPTNTPMPTTINAKACISPNLLCHNIILFCLCLRVMFLMAILSQGGRDLSIPFLKLSEK